MERITDCHIDQRNPSMSFQVRLPIFRSSQSFEPQIDDNLLLYSPPRKKRKLCDSHSSNNTVFSNTNNSTDPPQIDAHDAVIHSIVQNASTVAARHRHFIDQWFATQCDTNNTVNNKSNTRKSLSLFDDIPAPKYVTAPAQSSPNRNFAHVSNDDVERERTPGNAFADSPQPSEAPTADRCCNDKKENENQTVLPAHDGFLRNTNTDEYANDTSSIYPDITCQSSPPFAFVPAELECATSVDGNGGLFTPYRFGSFDDNF